MKIKCAQIQLGSRSLDRLVFYLVLERKNLGMILSDHVLQAAREARGRKKGGWGVDRRRFMVPDPAKLPPAAGLGAIDRPAAGKKKMQSSAINCNYLLIAC